MLTVNRLYFTVLLAGAGGFGWLAYTLFRDEPAGFGVCLVKEATGIPCPSCGTTRAIEALVHGNVVESVMINPFGMIVFGAMVAFPLWVLFDLIAGRRSFYNFYFRVEEVLKKKYVAIPLVILVLFNWIWNIMKGL